MTTLKMHRCAPAVLADHIREMKLHLRETYWGLADDTPVLSVDSVWLGLGSFLLRDATGCLYGGCHLAVDRKGTILLSHLFKVGESPAKILPTVLEWLATSYPGAELWVDCFDIPGLIEHYAKHGFEEYDRARFQHSHAPEFWSLRDGTPDVVYMARTIPGSAFGEGSY